MLISCDLSDIGFLLCCFVKQKTAYDMRISDWSSDVCSSDLLTLSQSQTRQLEQSHQALAASEAAYGLAQRRYAAGLSSQIVVLNAESNVLDARREIGRESCRERVCQYV